MIKNYKEKSRQIVNYRVLLRYKDGRILLGQKTKSGLMGYDSDYDYDRIMLYPTGYYRQHSYCGPINLGTIWLEGKQYRFLGEY